MSDRIDRDVINALIAGHFADPFSVLGMHKTTAASFRDVRIFSAISWLLSGMVSKT